MGVKYNPKPIQGVPTASALNHNFNAIQQALETALSRFEETGNQLQDDIDINGFTLINLRKAINNNEPVNLEQARSIIYEEYQNLSSTLFAYLNRAEQAADSAEMDAAVVNGIIEEANAILESSQKLLVDINEYRDYFVFYIEDTEYGIKLAFGEQAILAEVDEPYPGLTVRIPE